MYKSLPAAFLFQAFVGGMCVLSIWLSGPAWIASLAILGLRPLILKKSDSLPDAKVWQLYYQIGKISVVVVSVTIILVYIIYELLSHSSAVRGFWLLAILPYFIFVHGVIGCLYSIQKKL